MVKVSSLTRTEITTLESGWKEKHPVMANFSKRMEANMKVIGRTTRKMEKGKKCQQVGFTKEISSMARDKEKGGSLGPIDQVISENGKTTAYMARGPTFGATVKSTKVSGSTMKCMVREK